MRRRKDPALIKERHAAADAAAVLEAAARSLSGAPRSKRSLVERLIAAGYPEEHVITATDRLEAIGIIDDERLARSPPVGRPGPPCIPVPRRVRWMAASSMATRAQRII